MFYPNVPVNMICAGISGGSADNALKRIDRDVTVYRPDLTVVCFGLNDCCSGREGLQKYKESLEGIFDRLHACGSEIIFMTPNLMADSVSSEIEDDFLHRLAEGIVPDANTNLKMFIGEAREICKKRGITLCDCMETWETFQRNGIDITRLLSNRINHPTEKMHWLFAFRLFETIMNA